MTNGVAVSDRKNYRKKSKKIYKRRKRIHTCKYTPIGVRVEANGREICKMRMAAGWKNQSVFAEACGWSPTRQSQFEIDGRVELTLTQICKMIRVCNGGE